MVEGAGGEIAPGKHRVLSSLFYPISGKNLKFISKKSAARSEFACDNLTFLLFFHR
jgi:hypothetical protein